MRVSRSSLSQGAWRVLALGVAASLALGGCAGSSPSPTVAPTTGPSSGASSMPAGSASASPLAPATIDVWLGGVLTRATTGSQSGTWVQNVVDAFKAANPGSDVKLTLLPYDNDQLAAQVQAAFASKKVPDVIYLYSGAYTTVYQAGLLQLNDYINATPGFYDSITGWDGSCVNFDCQGGSGQILGVPTDNFAFYLFYNKSVLAKAGITAPPATWDEMISQCDTLVKAGITPWSYGDRDGYTTSNLMTTEITSFFDPGDVQKVLSGQLKYTDPKFINAFNAVYELQTHHCVQAGASTLVQDDQDNGILNGTAAYTEDSPSGVPRLAPLGDNLGVAVIPPAGTGPLASKLSTFSNGNWAIPKDAAHPDLAWSFIKTAMGPELQGNDQWVSLVGFPPANKQAAASVTNPFVKYIATQDQNSGMAVLDSVMPNAVALDWYRELQQAFAGKISIQDAMAAVQQVQDQTGP